MNHTALTLLAPGGSSAAGLFHELRHRQRALTHYALFMLALMVPALVLLALDPRTIRDVAMWAKPLKFMASTALFSLCTAWFMGLLPEPIRASRANQWMVWTLIATSGFEVGYISLQAALGSASHYNVTDLFHGAMFVLMAIAAVMLTATQAALAWQIYRHSPQRPLDVVTQAVIAGLVLTFVLSTVSGFMLGGVQPPAGMGMPVTGWHFDGGDARPAHFLGVHAQQFIPLAGYLLQRHQVRGGASMLAALTAAYCAAWLVLALIGVQKP